MCICGERFIYGKEFVARVAVRLGKPRIRWGRPAGQGPGGAGIADEFGGCPWEKLACLGKWGWGWGEGQLSPLFPADWAMPTHIIILLRFTQSAPISM